ncbi:hypothetical protein R3P38DRAFT_3169727 [Favolaschia claudopus]|uniref:Uncharacterized protein n=1 Tax=Favolaschia claudopus TaxID=2862362 RepID=A0AAW0E2C4_9AGAR
MLRASPSSLILPNTYPSRTCTVHPPPARSLCLISHPPSLSMTTSLYPVPYLSVLSPRITYVLSPLPSSPRPYFLLPTLETLLFLASLMNLHTTHLPSFHHVYLYPAPPPSLHPAASAPPSLVDPTVLRIPSIPVKGSSASPSRVSPTTL